MVPAGTRACNAATIASLHTIGYDGAIGLEYVPSVFTEDSLREIRRALAAGAASASDVT